CIGIGAVIEVLKSGDIIPKVVGVPTPASEPFRITHCPVCGAVAVVSAEGIASCGNIACPAQKARFLEFFCSKDVMDIAGMGPAMVSKLIDAQLLNTVQDIYELPSHASEIAVLDNMGEKSVQSLITAIEASKSNDIDRLIKGFGIPGVGRHIGKILAHCYPS
ncbi:MAG: helix-hairpin-helix domain-containing protein, partial [Ruthenibacterium sp.]